MCLITLICHRTSGVTQKSLWESIGMETKESIGMEPNQSIDMKPSKSIRMKANNFHYVVKTLQSQGLIVGKQAIVKSNDVGVRRNMIHGIVLSSAPTCYLSHDMPKN